MEYSVQRIEQALKKGNVIWFYHKNSGSLLYKGVLKGNTIYVSWEGGTASYSFESEYRPLEYWTCTKIEGEETMEKKTPHKHAELIKKWADGAIIQLKQINGEWVDTTHNDPSWCNEFEYRIKPNLVKKWKWVYENPEGNMIVTCLHYSSSEEFNNLNPYNKGKILQKVDSTMIEVEE